MSVNEVYEAYRTKLLDYAQCRVGAVAEDLVQKAFIDLMEYPHEVLQPRAFLYRCITGDIAHHLAKEKRQKRLRERFQPEQWEEPRDILDSREQAGRAKRIISTMKPVVADVLLEGCTFKEAAEKHGMTIEAVKQVVKRARKIIRAILTLDTV